MPISCVVLRVCSLFFFSLVVFPLSHLQLPNPKPLHAVIILQCACITFNYTHKNDIIPMEVRCLPGRYLTFKLL
ncbi:uncharacterized protein F4812DRAFT_426350 [Daldinia caldariorum]|uniref:uncharacterized protein n=1 Tax=Daldinia caldariorum TaxID=326644 RepID=UPI002008953D|nr:uncharacterized protein F4812DRAFT_426350 [Daldinia caldariorum]KAI1468343.1 hypothetical protein F4812DRAFT_426350 [Daldinia caldariorum]